MSTNDIPNFTVILNKLVEGSHQLEDQDALLGAVHKELQILAAGFMRNERANHTLQPTDLVHEVYLRLVDAEQVGIQGRTHFFGIAANAMRQVLIDHARKRNSLKRGGDWKRLSLTTIENIGFAGEIDLLDLDQALTKLEKMDPRAATVVTMKFFSGLKMEEIAQEMGVTRRTVQNDWRMAKMWLLDELAENDAT